MVTQTIQASLPLYASARTKIKPRTNRVACRRIDLRNILKSSHCGPSNLSAHIAEIVRKDGFVVGIDPSKERIALALDLEQTTPNLSFYEGMGEDLSRFASANFDAVFVNSTLHWIQDQSMAIAEFSRVLKSGGVLGISGQSGDFVAAHEKIKEDVLSREPYRRYLENSGPKFLRRDELESLLDQAGFSRREIVINMITKSAKDGAAMIEWLDTSSSGATYGGIPWDLRPKSREEMKSEWAKITTEEGIRMELDLLLTVAHKD